LPFVFINHGSRNNTKLFQDAVSLLGVLIKETGLAIYIVTVNRATGEINVGNVKQEKANHALRSVMYLVFNDGLLSAWA
jgi:hypothetical protein